MPSLKIHFTINFNKTSNRNITWHDNNVVFIDLRKLKRAFKVLSSYKITYKMPISHCFWQWIVLKYINKSNLEYIFNVCFIGITLFEHNLTNFVHAGLAPSFAFWTFAFLIVKKGHCLKLQAKYVQPPTPRWLNINSNVSANMIISYKMGISLHFSYQMYIQLFRWRYTLSYV